MTEARLGFAIDSSDAAGAAADLDRLTSSAMKVEQAAGRAGTSGTKMSKGFADVNPTLERLLGSLGRLEATASSIDKRMAAMTQSSNMAARANDNFGRSAAASTTASKILEASVTAITSAQRRGQVSTEQATAAIEKQVAVTTRLNAVTQKSGLSEGNKRFIGRDLGFQFQDIATTAIGGMSPKAIAFQQGTQIAGAVQGLTAKEAGGALLGALGGILSPISIASIAFTGLAAAGIQAFVNTTTAAKSLDDVLKDNADSISILKDRYGELNDSKASAGSIGGNAFVVGQARNQLSEMNKSLKNQLGDTISSVNNSVLSFGKYGGNGLDSLDALQNSMKQDGKSNDKRLFAQPVSDLLDAMKNGKGDLDAFNAGVDKVYDNLVLVSKTPEDLRLTADSLKALGNAAFDVGGQFKPFEGAINELKLRGVDGIADFNTQVAKIGDANPKVQDLSNQLIALSGNVVKLAQGREMLKDYLDTFDREDTRPGLADRRQLTGYVGRRSVDINRTDDQFAADQQMARARTNQEKLDAVAAQARSAKVNGDEGGGVDARVNRAVEAERTRQEVQQRDAARDRSLSLDRMLESQKEELQLVGKTGGAAEGLRKEFELIAQLKAEADRTGGIVSPAEVSRIHQATSELACITDDHDQEALTADLDFSNREKGFSL